MSSEFVQKQKIWKEQLSGKDRHAIWNRVCDIFTYDSIWRTYNEARNVSHEANRSNTGLAGWMIKVLDEGFFCLQVFELSKLIEKNWDNPQKHIYSIRRLFDEIKEYADLFTREAYVTFDGISYEEKQGENPRCEFTRNYRHGKYDIISSVPEADRDKKDKLHSAYLERIEKEFKVFDNLEIYRHKYLAHAADPVNRSDDILSEITLAYFDKCYQSLIRIGKMIEILFVDEILLCEPPIFQYDVLENWDKPAIASCDMPKLREFWDNRLEEITRWNENANMMT